MAELKPMIVTTVELTSKEYAAIHLCVPMSGNDELDAMIRKAQRERLAGMAMQGMMAHITTEDNTEWPYNGELDPIQEIAKKSCEVADAVIAGGEVK